MESSSEVVRSIHPLNRPKIFSPEEANELIPLLMLISSKTKRELNLLNSQLTFFKTQSDKAQVIQDKINLSLQAWSDKVRRLGAIPISLCKVRIPGHDAQYLWEYPEKRLLMQ